MLMNYYDLQNKIAILHPQVAVYENQHRLLSIEQHQVKIRMATLEKERILKEGIITKTNI